MLLVTIARGNPHLLLQTIAEQRHYLGQHFGTPCQLPLFKPEEIHQLQQQGSVLDLEELLACQLDPAACSVLSSAKVKVQLHLLLACRSLVT